MECNYEPTGVNAAFGINPINNADNSCNCKKKDEAGEKMLEKIQCLMFAITDIAEN